VVSPRGQRGFLCGTEGGKDGYSAGTSSRREGRDRLMLHLLNTIEERGEGRKHGFFLSTLEKGNRIVKTGSQTSRSFSFLDKEGGREKKKKRDHHRGYFQFSLRPGRKRGRGEGGNLSGFAPRAVPLGRGRGEKEERKKLF